MISYFFARRGKAMAAALVLLSNSASCTRIGQRPPRNEDQLLHTVPVETLTEGAFATVNQQGTELKLEVSRVCDTRTDRVVHRTSEVESYNQTPGKDWWLAAGALAAGGLGGGLLADARFTHSNDPTSRTYNPVGADQERNYGYGLIGLGAVLATVVVVDVVRSNGTETTGAELTITGPAEKHATACKGRPFANAQVIGELENRRFVLGTTNSSGQLVVNLEEAVPDDLLLRPTFAQLVLQVDGYAAGGADVALLYLSRERRSFEEGAADTCVAAENARACERLEQFLARYPDGPHARRAREALDAAAPTLRVLRDEAAWLAAHAETCSDAAATATEAETLSSACRPLQTYMEEFSDGVHATEASALLEKAATRVNELVKIREQAEAAATIDARIREILIEQSISSYAGNCPCPYNTARNGSRCGGRSAYSRPGGASPLCYPDDVTDAMVRRYRRSHGVK